MKFMLYGYSCADEDYENLLELQQVSICFNHSCQARALSDFIAQCAKEMEENPKWDHAHFAGGQSVDFIVCKQQTVETKQKH